MIRAAITHALGEFFADQLRLRWKNLELAQRLSDVSHERDRLKREEYEHSIERSVIREILREEKDPQTAVERIDGVFRPF